MANQNRTLGELIRDIRQSRGWTLRQMSDAVGIPLSTLAKVEADKLSMTYDKLQQLATRLGVTLAEFLAQGEATAAGDVQPPAVMARRSLASDNNSIEISTPTYDYEYLCTDLRKKRMVPILVRISAHDISEFEEPVRHPGEEFVFVLEGAVEVHLQFYAPVVLTKGQGMYLDSSMGHAYVAKDCDSALILAVCSSEDPDFAHELISLAESDAKRVA